MSQSSHHQMHKMYIYKVKEIILPLLSGLYVVCRFSYTFIGLMHVYFTHIKFNFLSRTWVTMTDTRTILICLGWGTYQ